MKNFIYHMKSGSNHGKGLKYESAGDYEKALHYFKQALIYAEKCDNEAMAPAELEAIAKVYFKMGRMEEFEKTARLALTKFEEIIHFGPQVEDRIKCLNDMLNAGQTVGSG